MSALAILGGKPVRAKPFPAWPQFDAKDRERLPAGVDAPAKADASLAGVKTMSRADRPRVEKEKNY